jgi:hypothetical protein
LAKRKRWRDQSYRTEPVDPRLVLVNAERLIGQPIVVFMPETENSKPWKRGQLVTVYPQSNRFLVKWTRNGVGRVLTGVWRVHNPALFTDSGLLPAPLESARVPSATKNNSRRSSMATRSTRAAKKSTATKTKSTTAAANGRVKDKLGHMTEAQRRKAAATIYKMRKDKKSWPEIMEVVDIPGSMTGRRLLRDYGPDDAETVIRERSANSKSTKKATASTSKKARGRAKVEVEDDEEDEDEEPAPKRRVRVKRGRGKSTNPS